jgi:hypothetical protein
LKESIEGKYALFVYACSQCKETTTIRMARTQTSFTIENHPICPSCQYDWAKEMDMWLQKYNDFPPTIYLSQNGKKEPL